MLPGPGLADLLREKRVSVTTMPPSIVNAIPPGDYPELRLMTVAGEACPAELVSRWGPGRRIINAYGPTEATVCATWAECAADGQAPPIGRPMARTRVYVVDANFQPVPVGVAITNVEREKAPILIRSPRAACACSSGEPAVRSPA